MNRNTPKRNKSIDGSSTFSSVTLLASPAAGSPQKNLTGPPRIIRDIIADLHNNIQRWNTLHIKGCTLIKQIAALKADSINTYSSQIEDCIGELFTVIQNLGGNDDCFTLLIRQTKAFAKLPDLTNPVFFSLDAVNIALLVNDICEAYKKELQVKQFVLHNIAHLKNKNDVMFLAACWTHQLNINESVTFKLESLLVETGHRSVK